MIVIECEQYSPIWWEEHKGIPGGSCADRIITPKTWGASEQIDALCYELLAQWFDPGYGKNQGYVTAAMRSGTVMEPEARQYAELELECHIKQVGLIKTDCKRFCCSPDGMTDNAIVELKSPMYKTHFKYLHKNTVPDIYLPQIHWNMAVSEVDTCIFISYCRGVRTLVKIVKRDERTETIKEAMESFSKRYEQIKREVLGEESDHLHKVLAQA